MGETPYNLVQYLTITTPTTLSCV